MKKTLLIISILTSALLVWYFYTFDEQKSVVVTNEIIDEEEQDLEYKKKFAELTNDNRDYAWQLIRVARKQLKSKEYLRAESSFREYEGLKLSKGWLMGEIDSIFINYYNSKLEDLPLRYAEIYENTGRIEEALNAYIESVWTYRRENFCGTGSYRYLLAYPNKLFKFNFALERYDSAFAIYLDAIDYHYDESDTTGLTEVIKHKLSNYSFKQRDSILNNAYKSLEVSIDKNEHEESYSTVFEIFNTTLYYGYQPNKEKDIDYETQVKEYSWDDFKRTRLYELLAERTEKE